MMPNDSVFGKTLRRPLGLALSGGGALGSWQAGVLFALEKDFGLSFDAIVGFSAGALNGAAFALGKIDIAVERWRASRQREILVLSPRLFPFSIFSNAPIESGADYAADEKESRKNLRSKLTLLSMFKDKSRRVERRFEPGGRWEGPLAQWIVASSSIPVIFPPMPLSYEGRENLFIDAGVSCHDPMSFQSLAGCGDVIVVEMIRSDEVSRHPKGFWKKIDHANRLGVRHFMEEGVQSLKALNPSPRIFRLYPSQALEFAMLDFSSPDIPAAISLGSQDAQKLVEFPDQFLTPPS